MGGASSAMSLIPLWLSSSPRWVWNVNILSNPLCSPSVNSHVLPEDLPTLPALPPLQGAHHLDLMFSNDADPPSVVEVRKQERMWIEKWIKEATGAKTLMTVDSATTTHLNDGGSHVTLDSLRWPRGDVLRAVSQMLPRWGKWW